MNKNMIAEDERYEEHEITAEEAEKEAENQAKLAEKLQVFGGRLSRLVTERVSKRADIEKRWLRDLRQFNGRYESDEEARLQDSEGSKIFVNLTRSKTNAAEARLSDMLFPTDDRNWGIRPTPIPQLVNAAKKGNPEEQDQARQIMDQAKTASEHMTTEIEDQLTESKYAAICRDAIRDACKIGTGIIKGPVVVGGRAVSWVKDADGIQQMQVNDNLRPGTQYVDPWNFYPDDSATSIEDSESNLERHYLTRKKLIKLAHTPGYLKEQFRLILGEGSIPTQTTLSWQSELREISGISDSVTANKYEMWEYTGPINKDELLSAGVEVEEDELIEFYGTVLFIDNHVVRVSLHPMDTEDDVYRVFNWEKDDASMFGFGIPYLICNPQKVVNGSWRMVLDNGGLSAGPQVVIDKDAIKPEDNDWTLKPRKIWIKQKSGVQVDHAFKVFQIDNNQTALMNIFGTARELIDEETNLPLIAQGEGGGNTPDTAKGMDMLMNSANIVLRRAVKNFDDDVTTPHITAYYNWNMQFGEDEDIKGDYKVDARGSGALLAREMQQERLMHFSNIAGSNEEFSMRTDWNGLYKQLVKHMQISKDDVMLPEDKVKEMMEQRQNQQPQISPDKQAELELKGQALELSHQEFQMKLEQEGQIRMADIASRENITIAQLKERTGIELHKEQNKRDIESGRQTLEQSKQMMQKENLAQGRDTF